MSAAMPPSESRQQTIAQFENMRAQASSVLDKIKEQSKGGRVLSDSANSRAGRAAALAQD